MLIMLSGINEKKHMESIFMRAQLLRLSAFLGFLMLTISAHAATASINVPTSLAGKTIIFYTHASPVEPDVREDSYRTYN